MNLSAVSSIKFTGENIQPAEVKSQQPQQTPEVVQTQPKEKKSKFAELKQLAKDTYSKSTPENTTNLFLTSGIMGIVSGVLNHVGKNHNVIKAIGTVGTIGAIASFALAASHVIKDRKQPVETAEPAKSPQPAPSAEIKEADEKQTEVKIKDIDKLSTIQVFADEFYIEQIITNYLTNAIKNVKEVDGEKYISIENQILEDKNKIRVKVFNTGENIPEEDLERIWQRFYKADKSRNRASGGSGIGLAFVKAIMNNYNSEYGVINCENGVEFYFDIDKV